MRSLPAYSIILILYEHPFQFDGDKSGTINSAELEAAVDKVISSVPGMRLTFERSL